MAFKRIVRRVGIIVLALVIVLGGLAVFATQTSTFKEWARGLAERQVTGLLNGEVSIGKLEGNLFTGAQFNDIRIRQDGREIVVIERATARFDLRRLLDTDIALTDVTLIRPVITLVHNQGGWRIANLIKPRPSAPATMRTFAIEVLTITDGTVIVDDGQPIDAGVRLPEQFTGLNTALRFYTGQGRVEFDIARAAFQTKAPSIDVRSVAGRLVNGDGLLEFRNFHVRTAQSAIDIDGTYTGGGQPSLGKTTVAAAPLDIDEFAAYLPALAGRGLTPTLTAALNGPFAALDVNTTFSDRQIGNIRAQVIADLLTPRQGMKGAVTIERLDLAALLNNKALASQLTARTNVDITFAPSISADGIAGQVVVHSTKGEFAGYRYDAVDGTIKIAGRTFTVAVDARGYGANARVLGTLTNRTDGVAYDLHGHVRNVDIRRLPPQIPIPELESVVAGNYTAKGIGSRLDGTIVFDDSTVEGVAIAAGSRGRVGLASAVPTYGFEGHVTNLDVQRVGRALAVEAISTDRYASRLTGDLTVDGAGRDLATLRLDATAKLEPSTLFDVTFNSANVEAHIVDRKLTSTVSGEFASLDLVKLTGREQLEGTVTGGFDLRATVAELGETPTLDTVTAEGKVTLGPSAIGPLAIDTAAFEGSYANRSGNITSLTITGRDLDVTASGPLMLGDSGESALKYHVAHGRLEDLSTLLGRDIAGRLTLDGTVGGNGAHLTSKGTASFAPLRIETAFDALEVESTFDASIDDLQADTIQVAADIDSTLPTVGFQSFRSLNAKVMYDDEVLKFDTTIRQEGRTVTGTGQVRLLESGREVRVEQLAIDAGGSTWTSASGNAFTATYGSNGLLTVDKAVFVSGAQRLTAQGSVSFQPGVDGALKVTVEQADVAGIGNILLVQRKLGGVLNGSGELTGDSEHRMATGTVALVNGVVDGFMFQSLDAALRYEPGRVGVDATLLQAPGSQLTVKGALATSTEGAAAGEPIDLAIKTEGIDLTVLEAASTAVNAVKGRLVADVHVRGTAAAPLMDGTIAVQDGAFTLVATGAKYEAAALDVALQGDQLRINRLHLQDDNGEPLDGTGSLSIQGRQFQNIDLTLTANEFKVLDNNLGSLSINTSLNINGTLLSPKIAGLVRVHAGRLEVGALVDRFTSNAYATESTEFPGAAPTPAPAPTPETPSAPVGPTFDITVEVPGNLVLRGNDIRPADAAVALGDLNVTVGGNFTIRKDPGAEPVLLGSVTTVRGTYQFQGRRFELLRDGTIAFRGERPIDPALDLQAERVISGIVAHVNINGSMRSPSLTLSSRPPLEDADILSLIIFNQPVNRLGEGQRAALGERAVGLASGFVVSPLADTLERALDIDLFEIETSTDDGGGPAITIGEQVGERFFGRFRQTFGAQNTSEFQLEYQISKFLRLQGSFAEGAGAANRSLTRRVERSGIDLVVFFTY